jgi:membrane protease YdiL (CAAX protease family)
MAPSLLGVGQGEANAWLKSTYAQFMYVLSVEAITISVLWLFVRHYKQRFYRVTGILRRPNIDDAGYGLTGYAGYMVILVAITAVLHLFTSIDLNQEQAIGFTRGIDSWQLGAAFISLVILPPLVEEMTFRGFLFGTFRARYGYVFTALMVSMLFAVPHLLTGKNGLLWMAAIDTFLLSLVLCYVREKTGSIWAGILIHACKNSLAFVYLFILGR